jgi:hypothetical protein
MRKGSRGLAGEIRYKRGMPIADGRFNDYYLELALIREW